MNDMLSWLLAGHMMGDYIFQNRWMAIHKTRSLPALAIHAVFYTAAVWVASLPAGGLSLVSFIFIFAAHAVIDKRDFTLWWCRHVTHSADTEWLVLVTDQAMHVVILALACLIG